MILYTYAREVVSGFSFFFYFSFVSSIHSFIRFSRLNWHLVAKQFRVYIKLKTGKFTLN